MLEYVTKKNISQPQEHSQPDIQQDFISTIVDDISPLPTPPRLSNITTFIRQRLRQVYKPELVPLSSSNWQKRFILHFQNIARQNCTLPETAGLEWNESLGELAISAELSMRSFAPEEVAEQYYKQWHTHYLTLNNDTIPLPKKTLQAFLDLSWIEMWQEMKRVGEALLSNSLLQMKDYVIHGNLVSYILSNIVEHGHFGTIVRLIQRMGMKVAIAFIQHTLSLIPEGNPIRAVLAVLSDAGQATTELSTANPVLVALTTALTVTWIIQAEECIDIPQPVTEVGRRLAGLPDLLKSLYDIISSFAMLPRRSQGTLTQLYADPTDISGYLGGSSALPLANVNETTPVLHLSQALWTPDNQEISVQIARNSDDIYKSVRFAHNKLWPNVSPALSLVTGPSPTAQMNPVMSRFLSDELNKADSSSEAFRGVHCEIMKIGLNLTGDNIWGVRFTGWLSQGNGEGILAARWTTRMDDEQKAELNALFKNGEALGEVQNTDLKKVMAFLSQEATLPSNVPASGRAEIIRSQTTTPVEEEAMLIRMGSSPLIQVIKRAGEMLSDWQPSWPSWPSGAEGKPMRGSGNSIWQMNPDIKGRMRRDVPAASQVISVPENDVTEFSLHRNEGFHYTKRLENENTRLKQLFKEMPKPSFPPYPPNEPGATEAFDEWADSYITEVTEYWHNLSLQNSISHFSIYEHLKNRLSLLTSIGRAEGELNEADEEIISSLIQTPDTNERNRDAPRVLVNYITIGGVDIYIPGIYTIANGDNKNATTFLLALPNERIKKISNINGILPEIRRYLSKDKSGRYPLVTDDLDMGGRKLKGDSFKIIENILINNIQTKLIQTKQKLKDEKLISNSYNVLREMEKAGNGWLYDVLDMSQFINSLYKEIKKENEDEENLIKEILKNLHRLQGLDKIKHSALVNTFVAVPTHGLLGRYANVAKEFINKLIEWFTSSAATNYPTYGDDEIIIFNHYDEIYSSNARNDINFSRPYSVVFNYKHQDNSESLPVTVLGINKRNNQKKTINLVYHESGGLFLKNFKKALSENNMDIKSIRVNQKGEVSLNDILLLMCGENNDDLYEILSGKEELSQDDMTSIIEEIVGRRSYQPLIFITPNHNKKTTSHNYLATDYLVGQRIFRNINSSDYKIIESKLNEVFNDVINELESSDNNLKGGSVLEHLKNDVGISVKITVKDTDGEDDIYIKTHTVNNSDGNSLSEYFKHIAKQIADHVIVAIRDPEGENEGKIYITNLEFEYVIPQKQRNSLLLSDLDVYLMGIFNAYNPNELLNPSSPEYGSQLQDYAVKVRSELAGNNTSGFVKSKLLMEAINRAVRYYKNHPGRLEGYDRGINRTSYDEAEFYNHVIKEVFQAFFKTETYLLRQQQRALIVAQPSQAEFISREICKYLSIDERKWSLVITAKEYINIILTPASSGAIVTKYSDSEQMTEGKRISLFELLYDNEFRALIGGAPNKQEAISNYVDKLRGKLELNDDDVLNLKDKISELVSSYNLFIASFPSQEGIPDDLQKPINGFNIFNEKYVEFAMGVWRNLEAEIIIKEAPDAFDRITKNKSNAPYVELLTNEENKILDDRCEHVRRHFELARNKDNFKDLPTKGASLENIIWRDIVKPVLSNSPLLIGQAIIFVDDLVNATDAEDIVIQGLFVVSGILAKIRSPTANGLSKLSNFGANSVLIVRSAYDYQKAVKEHRWDSANQSLVMLFMSAHGHLDVSEGILNDFITQREKVIEEVQNQNSKSEHTPPLANNMAVSKSEPFDNLNNRGRYEYITRLDGDIVITPPKAIIEGIYDTRDLITTDKRVAIALGNGIETVYMIDGEPTQAVGSSEGSVLRMISEMPLETDDWEKLHEEGTASNTIVRSNDENKIFPSTFTGIVSDNVNARNENAVGFMNNHYSQFDIFDGDITTLNGEIKSDKIHVGILEHKYVLYRNGQLETLDFIESHDGTTSFFCANGEVVSIPVLLTSKVHYKQNIKAKIIGSASSMLAVEVENSVDGLSNKRTVPGFIANRLDGGQMIVIELDKGIHYFGYIQESSAINIADPNAMTPQPIVELNMEKINPQADPKRASSAFYNENSEYRKLEVAQHDFILNLFYGAKYANEAYSVDPSNVIKNKALLINKKNKLPEQVFDTGNPFFELDVTPEEAALFSPANQRFIAQMLSENHMRWGRLKESEDILFVENNLNKLEFKLSSGDYSKIKLSHDLSQESGRIDLHQQLGRILNNGNLVICEITLFSGEMKSFVGVIDEQYLEDLNLMGNQIDAFTQPDENIITSSQDVKILKNANNLINILESYYPIGTEIKAVRFFSNFAFNNVITQHIFSLQGRGYHITSVTHLHDKAKVKIGRAKVRKDGSFPKIKEVNDIIDSAYLITEGEQKGAYFKDGEYYIQLEVGVFYRTAWDEVENGFRLLPENSNDWSRGSLPLVRYYNDKFWISNHAGTFLQSFNLSEDGSNALRRYAVNINIEDGLLKDGTITGLFVDSVGNQYIQLSSEFYVPTKLDGNDRVIYSQTNPIDRRIVILIQGEWLVVDKYMGRGGGKGKKASHSKHIAPKPDDPSSVPLNEATRLAEANKLILINRGNAKSKIFYHSAIEPTIDHSILPEEVGSSTVFYRAMGETEFNALKPFISGAPSGTVMNNFAKLDPLGYIGITPNENYAYQIFSRNNSNQPYLIKFDLNGNTLKDILEGETSDFKIEGYGRSFGLGERGTDYLAGTAATGRPGDHFFNAIKNGEISVSLIGVKSCID